ncbi:recombinase family protein [Paracoccus fistulariae]|uniref:Recombinase family protein n=1 Tax=Paracoccus fistulariae TaxID=658446 RepID=A0ABY7SIQ2_9RHOB|nr:recombinase family protein [Paracoccus fistulariae]MDB6181974.1 recombinase family protein [Paracoccus fistulariae]WCR06790.1 recombinase family protein [Paracoccus fistulariae]
MQTILYARVSTQDQTSIHQKAQAEKAGFKIDRVVADEGVSGVSVAFADRPEARRLFDMLRPGDVLVVRWVDRLGRNYDDVTNTIRSLMAQGIIVRTVINNFTFDGSTKDPVQKAVRDSLIAFMAATAQAQAEATKEAQKAGIAHAKGQEGKYLGRKPSYDRQTFNAVLDALQGSATVSEIARTHNLSRQAVLRIRDNTEQVEAALAKWS